MKVQQSKQIGTYRAGLLGLMIASLFRKLRRDNVSNGTAPTFSLASGHRNGALG